MRVGIGQMNPHVGAISENTQHIIAHIDEARNARCDLVVFPEMAIPGYAPLDLVWRSGFVDACSRAADRIRGASNDIGVVVGSIAAEPHRGPANRLDLSSVVDGADVDLYNVAYLFENGELVTRVAKTHLQTYDVHDDKRYFNPSLGVEVQPFRGLSMGISICEDLWIDEGPTELQASLGADWIVNLSASPFYVGKQEIRRRLATLRARESGVGIIYVNLIGGQDDVVFDGGSLIVDPAGELLFQAPQFRDGLYVVNLGSQPIPRSAANTDLTQIRRALTLGIRDYVQKNRFSRVLLGLSGGIDSALVAALATEALGPDAVTAVYLPSEFSSPESDEDAHETAQRLGIDCLNIPITKVHHALRAALPGKARGIVDENLQPRTRGILLMALANQRDALVLCPGNKSEIAVGYNTLYGDTVGALAPIADLYKSDVVRLAETYADVIPPRIFEKAPSAELKPDQRDVDDLPPYAVLDPLLHALIEEGASREQLVARGLDADLVDGILLRVCASEHKRGQLPPGIKVTPKAFGTGRRIPLTNAYRG